LCGSHTFHAGRFLFAHTGENKMGDDPKKKQLNLFAKTHEFNAEIFSAGKWNGDEYSESDLQDIADNFNELADKVKPPVKLGHAWKEGQPALGWVKALDRAGSKLVATLTDVPQIVYDAIQAGRYKRVSSEIYWNYKSKAGKTYNYVLKAVALLGADIPAVSDLEDLAAYLTQISVNDGSFERVASYEFEAGRNFELKTKEPDKEPVKKKQEKKKMADDDVKKYEEKLAKEKAERKTAEEAAQAAEAKLKKFKEDQEADRQEMRVKAFKDECEALVKAGTLTTAERKKLVDGIPTFKYTEDGFFVPFIDLKAIAESRQIMDTIEYGEDGNPIQKQKEYADASEELADRARTYRLKNPKVSYSEAAEVILAEDTDLADRYKMDE
jgi:hypothetical protein